MLTYRSDCFYSCRDADGIFFVLQHTAVLSMALCWRISSNCLGSLVQSHCGEQLLCLDLSFCNLDDSVVRTSKYQLRVLPFNSWMFGLYVLDHLSEIVRKHYVRRCKGVITWQLVFLRCLLMLICKVLSLGCAHNHSQVSHLFCRWTRLLRTVHHFKDYDFLEAVIQ